MSVFDDFRRWLRCVPAGDACTRYNAPAMQWLMLAYAALLVATWTWRIAFDGCESAASATLAVDTAVVVSALGGVVLVRRGMFTPAVLQFLLALLCSIAVVLLAHGAASRIVDAETPMILVLVISGVMLGRRALWMVFAGLAALFTIALVPTATTSMTAHSTLARLPSIAVLFLLITMVLDRHVRALRQKLADAMTHQAELRREMEARERAQARLIHARKVEATGQLASGIAHDFNNLLDLILGYATQCDRILELDSRAAQDAAIARVLSGIEGAALRGAAITGKLLAFTRHELARPQRFDAGLAIAEMQPLLRQLLPRSIELDLPEAEGAFFVRFDRGEFDLMILNIASNARDAMAHGGRFAIHLAQEGDHVRLVLSDTGHGMTPDVRERVFEPFFSTKNATGGTGLGLAVIQDIVLGCGGEIWVESDVGEGTTFHVRIPASGADDPMPADRSTEHGFVASWN